MSSEHSPRLSTLRECPLFRVKVTQIMHENPGQVMHYDDLIMRLYGELSGDELKAERGRIKTTMYQGAQKELEQSSKLTDVLYLRAKSKYWV